MTVAVPQQIGPFEVARLIGQGAMGEVFEGMDPQLGRRVALKVLGSRQRESVEFQTRLLQEGRALAAMNHPNIVQIYSVGEFEGRPYLAMEYLDGEDVGQLLAKYGPLHPGDASEIVRQAAIGLSQAHKVNVIHRDVKPANLVVTGGGLIKVTDFGLAKALEETVSITATGLFVGTPDYLAPEQAASKSYDPRSDVYSLGCSLYHMCSGDPPFRKSSEDEHYTAVVRRHLQSSRPQLLKKIPGFDKELSDLCRAMMSRRMDVRPSMEEVIQRVGKIARRLAGMVPPRTAPTSASGTLLSFPGNDDTEARRLRTRRRLLFSAVALLFIVAAVFAANL